MTTALLLRLLVILGLIALVFFGGRRIWRDWRRQFAAVDKARRERDLKERARPDVITLERGRDGTFRPPGDDDRAA